MIRLNRSLDIRLISTLAATLFAVPAAWHGLTGLYTWLSPFITLNSVIVLKSTVWLNSLGLIVLIFSFFYNRWFCRYLCPLGYGCDLASSRSCRRNFSLAGIPDIGRWLALISLAAAITGIPLFILLDPLAIFNGFFSIFTGPVSLPVVVSFAGLPVLILLHLFLPGLWCGRVCPLGGLQNELTSSRKRLQRMNSGTFKAEMKSAGQGRRMFIATLTGLISGIIISRFTGPGPLSHFRPPGAVEAGLFNSLCIRCGNCIKACPTNILVHRTVALPPGSWMTPELTFENNGYCPYDCNLCSRVCPSGAITLFSTGAKSLLKIATAVVIPEDCLLTESVECDRCKSACNFKAIEIVDSGITITPVPVADENICTGCGACAAICPAETIQMMLSGQPGA